MPQIEIDEADGCKFTDPETGQHYDLSHGDRVTVSDTMAGIACGAGWAHDVADKIPTGDRVPGAAAVLIPANVKSKASGG